MADDQMALDYFTGGVPAGATLSLELQQLTEIVRSTRGMKMPSKLLDLAFIGRLSYFEAFCKDHFASMLNVLPDLSVNLKNRGHDVNVDVTDLLSLSGSSTGRLGFILAEKYDFGTPRKINALYQALIGITLFSSKERQALERLLSDRNLLVPHGGVYTMRYARQVFEQKQVRGKVFLDSLVIDATRLESDMKLIARIGKKIATSTQSSLESYVVGHELALGAQQKKALDLLGWWDLNDGPEK